MVSFRPVNTVTGRCARVVLCRSAVVEDSPHAARRFREGFPRGLYSTTRTTAGCRVELQLYGSLHDILDRCSLGYKGAEE